MAVLVKGGGGKPEEEKTVTAGTSVIEVLPSSGKVMKKVTVHPTPSQEKTIENPSETTVILPDSGKMLSKVTVEIFNPSLVTWANGTDEQIVKMVKLADEGKINLSDYWTVGDTRTIQLSAMSATGVGESHATQQVDLVLMHAGGYDLNAAVASGRTKCSFVVGLKDSLKEAGYMNSSDTNSGSWNGSARRTWCNNVFRNAIPSTFRAIFKQFKTVTAQTYNGSTNQTSVDYFALPAEREIFDARKYCNQTEYNALFQFDYYKTESNRVKKLGKTGAAGVWWERSPYYNDSASFCDVYIRGSATSYIASFAYGLAPFGCI